MDVDSNHMCYPIEHTHIGMLYNVKVCCMY